MPVMLSQDRVPDAAERDAIAAILAEIACAAGVILRRYETGPCPHRFKEDGSPTTDADLAAEASILAALRARWPEIPVVAEETAGTCGGASLFFLVDPLDGTRDFLRGTGEYSVNIALIASGRPVAAALAAPALGRVWRAGVGAFEAPIADGRPGPAVAIAVRPTPREGMTALVSRLHGNPADEACLARLPIGQRRPVSSALKFGLIAAGDADLYLRSGPTMEWDTAAGDHILTQAGGCLVDFAGRPFLYGRRAQGYRNGPFAALGDPAYAHRVALPSA
ncbi:3'(2'),5'-bisphosphate nucleotidase CysQ family protein [Methylobacterium nodulans]|uniref:3'(2'),5-bisphosphonucleoside 3'(2')-phosphohydrolase n=1 Tax=Methylobacterium nodulans (strain LMG 21967 / CNCM I-2342 / ORS 2060) TaxID=460265 RepID=B8IQX7_METNO|nr:3'(2'),5'-bisphosphate nucleotidase CysQ [Methylobacterium nodulans]ACL56679.1 inositol monophosphatase [Methylobacterium nodulans ORS 2060]